MKNALHCDLAIIGAGSAGLSLASMASQLGWKVILIEKGKMGGDCLNYGCIPSKAFLAASKKAEAQWKNTSKSNRLLDELYEKTLKYVAEVIAGIAPHDSVERFTGLGVEVIKAEAEFISPDSIKAGNNTIKAARFAIATGSKAYIPPVSGIEDVPFLTNETIFSLKQRPEHLIIIGGGPIGCELAQGFAKSGCRVSIIEADRILNKDCPEASALIRKALENDGVNIYEQTRVIHVSHPIKVLCEGSEGEIVLQGSHLLVASGRKPALENLQLEKAKVEYQRSGITVNARQQTTNKKIYALGDVAGPYPFTHMAEYQAGIVLKNILFALPAKADYSAVPWVTYTSPELAHVGQSSTHLKPQQQLIHYPLCENDRARTEGKTEGFINIVCDRKGKVQGVTIVSEGAGELLLPWIMIIREKKTLRSLTDAIIPYPSISEISKRAAGEFYRPKLFSPKVLKIVNWLKRLRRIQ